MSMDSNTNIDSWQATLFSLSLMGICVKLFVHTKFWSDFDRKREYLLDVAIYLLLRCVQLTCLAACAAFTLTLNVTGIHIALGTARAIRVVSLFIKFRKNNKPLQVYDDLEYIGAARHKFGYTELLIRNTYSNNVKDKEWVCAFRNAFSALLTHIIMAIAPRKWFIVVWIAAVNLHRFLEIGVAAMKFVNHTGGNKNTFELTRVFSVAVMASGHIVTDTLLFVVYIANWYTNCVNLYVIAETIQHLMDDVNDVQYFFYLSRVHRFLMDQAPFVFAATRSTKFNTRKIEREFSSGHVKSTPVPVSRVESSQGITVTELEEVNPK